MSDFRKRLEERAREEQKNAGRETGPRFSDVLAEYKKGRQAEEAYQTYLKQMQMKPVSDSIYTQYTGQMDNYRKTVEDFNSGINQPYKMRQAELMGAKARTLIGRLMAQNEGLDTSWYEQVARDYTSAYDSLTDLGKEQHARGERYRDLMKPGAEPSKGYFTQEDWDRMNTPGGQAEIYEDLNRQKKEPEPGALELPAGTRAVASTYGNVSWDGPTHLGVPVIEKPSDKEYQKKVERMSGTVSQSVIHPDLRGVQMKGPGTERGVLGQEADKYRAALDRLLGPSFQDNMKNLQERMKIPGMGVYDLQNMDATGVKNALSAERDRITSGAGDALLEKNIRDYYYANFSQGTAEQMQELESQITAWEDEEYNLNIRLKELEQKILYQNLDASEEEIQADEALAEQLIEQSYNVRKNREQSEAILQFLPMQKEYLELQEETNELRKDPDFLAKAMYRPEKGFSAFVESSAYDDYEVRLGNSMLKTPEAAYQYIAGKYQFDPENDLDGLHTQALLSVNPESRGFDKLRPDEKQMYMYIYNTKGKKEAGEYLDRIQNVLLYRRAMDNQKDWDAYARQNGWTAAWSTIMSVPLNMLNAGMTPFRAVHTMTGGSPYDPIFDTQRQAQTYRAAGGQMMGEVLDFNIPIINANAGELIYGVATSMADMWAAAGVSNLIGADNMVSVILGSAAASSTMMNALESGKSAGQAVTQGLIVGYIAHLTEQISWEGIKGLGKMSYSAQSGLAKNIARSMMWQAGTEGAEEGLESIAGMALSILMYGVEGSEFGELQEQVKADAIAGGETLDEGEVFTRALVRFAQDVGSDVLAGMMAGGLNGLGVLSMPTQQRTQLIQQLTSDRLAVSSDLRAKIDQYGGKQIQFEGQIREALDRKPVSEMSVGELLQEGNETNRKVLKDFDKMSVAERADVSDRLAEIEAALSDAMLKGPAEPQQDTPITPRRAPERPTDPASERLEEPEAQMPREEKQAPVRPPERPLDPASEAIAMPPVSEAIEPRKAPERPQDPVAERIESEPQTGTGYTGLAREYGMAGLRTSDLESVIGKDNLTDEVLQAHKEGVSQAKVEARMRTEEILGRREAASKRGYLKSISEQEATANGVNTIGKMSPAIRKASTALRVIAESTGINVVLFESPINDKGEHTGKQGWFDSAKRTIYLDVKAGYGNEEATLRAAGHELTHVIQKFSPEFYENTYKPAVIDALYEGNEGTMLDLVQEQIRIAKENGKTMTESQAMFEVIADASERMLMGDQATITGLVEQNPDLFKRVKNWIDNFVNSLRRAYTILKADSSAAKVLEGTYERFKGIQEMWWNGLQDAALNIRGQQEAMPISAYEQSRDAAREAKLQRIGTGLINPAMYEPVDYRQYAPKPQAKPIEPTIRRWEAFEKAKAEDDFGGMFAAAINEEAVENMTPEDLDALLSLPGADKLAEEGKKTTPTTAKKPDKVLSDGVAPVDKLKGLPVKFRNLVKKWAGNEYVNVDINDMSDQNAQNFVDWAKKWYNYGREGNWPELGIFDDNDLNFPPFLQNTFFNQGKADAEKSIKPTKPVEAGGKPDVRGTEDYETGGIPEVEERLPGQGQADEPSTGETVGAGPQAGGVLEEVSSEDVQQPGGPGGTARDSDGGIRPAVRDDVTTDAPGSTRGPGVGSSERGDLQQPGRDITDDVIQAAAEAAKRREAEANKGKNYVIPPEGLDLPGGQKTRFNLNVEAIKIAKALEAEGRIATPEEQQALARYVGWGGIPDAFDARGRVKEGWEAENQTLKELLSEEEYDAARRSTTNAHYTEIGIIRSMYGALKKWGFKGGYVLEPSSGIGNFIGAAPSFGKQVRWTAVELDSTTALIAKHLYPQANVHHAGFQDVQLPDNYFDLAISNVPFSETGPVDKKYPKFLRSNLHNYFFVKSMDKVRPGGLVMFITSRFTMDSANSSFREYMARHADLVGAVRLPDTAFKQNANTEVVTDLLVFKKRQPNTEYTGQPFAHAGAQIFDSPHTSYGARHNVNEYFLNNPDMVLGTPTISRGVYSANTLTYKAIEGKALTEQLSEALSKINVKVDYVERTADPMKAADEVVKASSRTKNNGYEVKDGKVYQNNNGTLDLADDINKSPDKLARVTTMLGLRDLRKQLLHAQLQGKEKAETDRLRKELNKQYDAFVKKHGFLNSKENARLMYDDPDSFSLLALEDYRPAEGGKPEQAIKTDIFVKDTIASATRATSAKNPEEALAISINELGYLEPERMGELLSVTPDQAEALLLEQQLAFKDEDGALIPAPVYLSGRVRSKLIIAKQMAAVDKSYQANVEALESVIPVDVPVEDISMPLGATWIPTEYYEGFIRHILDLPTYQGQVKVQMNPLTSSYKIELDSAAKRRIGRRADIKYGAGNWSFLKILDKIMNGGSMKATYKDQDGRTQTDKATTAAINEKAEQIKSEFVQWIKSDPDLAAPIARLYNDTFNDTVEATFDGENLTIDGANPSMPLKPHQKAVIQRALQSGGNMLIAHATGAGKTAEMAGIAMKMRQLGILKKPLFVVPKPVATQWGQEFLTFFPNAKVLVPQDADYEARNRKTYINKIISNDYDAVILSYEMFEAIPLSGEAMRSFYQAQIDEAMEALQAAKDDDTEGDRVYYSRAKPLGKDWTVKQIEKQLEKLQKRIEELDSKNKRDEDNVDFEELGVDGLFVDEAHNFKNLRVYTHLQNVAGINTSAESGRAFDLLAKVQHMQKLNGGKGVFFATATPVMNTLGELFVMQRYLMPDVMRDKGIYNFDAWVNAFASVMKELSINATGTGYKVKDTLSKFVNLPELQTMFRSFADVIPVVEGLKIPKVKGGKPFIHEVEPTEFQKEYVKDLADRANNISGRPEKGADNMLKITTEGRKVALSGRLVDVTQDIELDGKLAVTAKEIVRVYKESKKHKGTQLVFMDIGVPGANEALNMYAALKDMLVAAGIPSAQIKTIYDAKNEVGRKKLFRQVNDGTVRVLMGSTGKMGTGVNVQQRVAAMHHIDVPYRPGDLTQRNGRGQRQGNLYTDLGGIEIHYYVTKGTFDSYMWQKVQTKSAFIEQLMTNENKLRESEGESMNLTAAEVTAIASGNPMILEKFALENDLMKLAALKDQHDNDITHAKKQIHSNKTQIASLKKQIEAVKKDIAQKVDTKGDKFSMVVGNTTYKDRVKAGKALIAMYSKASKGIFPADGLKAGKLGGFNIVLQSQGAVQLQTNKGVAVLINPESASGTIARIENALNFDGQVEGLEQMVSKAEADIAAYQEALEKPFERQEEYTQKKTRYDEIMAILAPNKNEGAETSDEKAADSFDGMESDERDLDYSFRRLAADDFLQEREDDPGRIEDRTILAERLDSIDYSDRDPSRLSNRERLVDALETVALNDYEKDIIKRYKDKLESITKDAELLKATNAQIRELSFAPGPRDMDQLIKLKNNKQTLLNKIARQDARLLKIEAAQPLANLVNLEKRRAERALKQQRADLRREYKQEVQERVREVRQKGAEKLTKYKQNQEARKYKGQIVTLVKNMSEKLVNPSKNGYYPEALKGPLGDVLKSINQQSKRSLAGGDSTIADREFYDSLNKLQSVLSRINRSQQSAEAMSEDYAELAGFIDLPAGFVERMAELADIMERYMKMNTGEYVLNAMTAEELKALFKMLTALDRSLETINQLHIQGVFAHVDQMGKYSIQHGDNMKSKLHREGKIDKFLNWDNTLPVYAFERMGKAGQSLFDGFRRGMDKQSKLAQEIVEFSETTFTPAEAREWGKQIITVTLDGNEVRLTAAHLMELYAHNRREQSRGHIYGAGIKVNNFKVGTTTYAHRGDVTLPSEITAAFEQLTDRQKEVALALQTFMSKRGGGLIDEVNMARFGAKQLDDENDTYWPIKSVPQNIDTKMEAPEGNPLYRILNMSFMKPLTKGANNQIVISNIFDTFASHMADVIQLNAFALPVLDAIKWFNYRQSYKNPETGQKYVSSVRSSIRNAFGEAGEKYVTRMLLDLNGSRMTGGGEEAAMTMLRHYNRSVVAANLRVALLQPTSIVRALNVIDARYLGMGALTNLAHLRRNIREMEKHSGIAIWKQLGFYDVNISRSIQDLIKRDNPLMDRLTDKTMVLPQTMDRITWAAIWDASKRQAAAENPGLNKNSEEYWDKVKALFDTAIYKTQVVDTMLTRSEYMRRPSFVAKWTSSFMSEPTMTYNILSSQVHTFNDDVASGMSRGAAWRKNGRKITRTATTYALSVALVTMAEALSGAWRDDDEYMTFTEKLAKAYKNNLIDNLMPLNLPIINDLWQITKRFVGQTFGVDLWGFADASPLTQGVQLMYDGFTAVTKVMNGEGKNMTLYGAGYKLLQGISAVTGHPFSSMTREVVDLWNNTAGKMYPEYKVKRYEQSMNAGYKALFDALQGGDNERSQKIRDVLDRMGVDDKKVYSGLRGQAREAYKEGKLDFDDAVSMLGAEQGSPEGGVYWTVKEWSERKEADDWSAEFEYSRYNALYDAVLSGENLREIVKELQENFSGQPENAKSTIASQITNHFKPEYIEAYKRSITEAANLKARLLTVYALLGYDRTKKNKDIDAWLK